MIAAEINDCLVILTLAIWKSKIDEIYAEQPNAKQRRTRSHVRRHMAWWQCQSDVILLNVLTFLPPPV
jgi:hypothetical protein